MGEIIDLGKRLTEEVDPMLTKVLGSVRNKLHSMHGSNDVVTHPLIRGFKPHIKPNGTMQLASLGVEDFKERYKHFDINPLALHVLYFGWRTELESARITDSIFHYELLKIAREAGRRGTDASHEDAHTLEARLLGAFAVRVSLQTLKVNQTAAIKSAAQYKLPRIADREFYEQRQTACSHFHTGMAPVVVDKISNDVTEMVTRRVEVETDTN